MNYIKHLSGFYGIIADDRRLSAFHVSLYLALFQFWNANRFENPVLISREEVMNFAKIGSSHTYYKCIRELDAYGYLKYEPSHNPLQGSLVSMVRFDNADKVQTRDEVDQENHLNREPSTPKTHVKSDTTPAQAVHHTYDKSDTSSAQVVHHSCGKSGTTRAQVVHPSLNNIKHINNKTFKTEKKSDQDFKNKIPPEKENVIRFFKAEKSNELEANKFFNYFESNGWKVGGRAKMKNWQAAARNWILNAGNFKKPDPGKLKTDKNYGEPL